VDIKQIDIEKVAKAAELDAGHALPGLRESLAQAKRGEFGAVHTPEQIKARRAGRPVGTVKAAPKVSTTIRLSPEVVQAFRAAGDGWQTRIDAALKDWLRTHSPV
jgi:uncharacterized protein (DUF4415 family)